MTPRSLIRYALPLLALWPLALSAQETGYDEGFFVRSEDGDFALTLGAVAQLRLDVRSLEGDAGDGRELEAAFRIRRGRLVLSGHAFAPELTWKLQLAMEEGVVELKDLYLDYAIIPEALQLRAGQWKRPFSRQFLNSGTELSLVERAITHDTFAIGRDIGLALHNDAPDAGLEWSLGLFNGLGDAPRLEGEVLVDPSTGEGRIVEGSFTNVPDVLHPALVGRLGYSSGMDGAYREGDFEGGPLRFAVALSALADFDADDDDSSTLQAELDGILKAHGFTLSAALYVASAQSGEAFSEQRFAGYGGHLQTSFLIGDRVLPAARYTLIALEGADVRHEATLGCGALLYGHNAKLQFDTSLFAQGGALDVHARLLLQLLL